MSQLQTSAPGRARGAMVHLLDAGANAARRLFLDRQIDFWLAELNPAWSLREVRATVVQIVQETHDVKTFVLAPHGAWPGHRAGQYVPIEVELDGARVRRCYSISSAPSAQHLAVTVKRVPGGRVSSHLHDHVNVGDVLGIGAPGGDFVLPEAASPRLLFVTGGSGITPAMSMLRALDDRGVVGDVVFVHCAQTRADAIFRDELERLAARHRGLEIRFVFDEDGPREALSEDLLRQWAPDFAERAAFVCGPAGMMDALEELWKTLGLEDQWHSERFVARAPLAAVTPEGGGAKARVHLLVSRRSVALDGEGTLLEQLERAGERPAHGCRMGICNTCRCRKRSGSVVDAVTGTASSEPDQEIKLCVSRAGSDLELEL